ncbi:flagellin, partial [bacterium]|nr:flagellin [bacterium]
ELLDGSLERMIIQTGGSYEAETNTIDIRPALTDCNLTALGLTSVDAGGQGLQLPTCMQPDHADFGSDTAIQDYVGTADAAFGDAFRKYMEDVQHSINVISSSRGLLGAYTNRMDATSSNLANVVENLETAKSRLTDVDIAKASSDMVKYQILQQTATAVLSQANQLPSLAIQLIG